MEDISIKVLLFISVLQVIPAAVLTPVTDKTTQKPSLTTRDPNYRLYARLDFHYNRWSKEHLLLVMLPNHDCYFLPLTNDDILKIQQPEGLQRLEAFMIHQIGKNLFSTWTQDDVLVRDDYWGKRCHQKVFRVFRL